MSSWPPPPPPPQAKSAPPPHQQTVAPAAAASTPYSQHEKPRSGNQPFVTNGPPPAAAGAMTSNAPAPAAASTWNTPGSSLPAPPSMSSVLPAKHQPATASFAPPPPPPAVSATAHTGEASRAPSGLPAAKSTSFAAPPPPAYDFSPHAPPPPPPHHHDQYPSDPFDTPQPSAIRHVRAPPPRHQMHPRGPPVRHGGGTPPVPPTVHRGAPSPPGPPASHDLPPPPPAHHGTPSYSAPTPTLSAGMMPPAAGPSVHHGGGVRPPPPPGPPHHGMPTPPGPPMYGGMPPSTSAAPTPGPPTSHGGGMPPPPPPGPSHYAGPPQQPQKPQQQQPLHRTKPKIDPTQIPRPPLFTRPEDPSRPIPIYQPKFSTLQPESKAALPPPADSRFLVQDDGNAAPQLIRSTLYAIPKDSSILRKTGGMDMGVLCCPLAIASNDYVPRPKITPDHEQQQQQPVLDPQRIPVIALDENNGGPPLRCPRCQAYVNPFWSLTECNFCRTKHNHDLRRGSSRPMIGTVEYEVGGPYVTRSQPVAPVTLYAIDATLSHLHSYVDLVKELGSAMSHHWRPQQAMRTVSPRIGCCLVSCTGVVVVSLKPRGDGEMTISVMSDVTVDPFCQSPLSDWTYDVSTNEGLKQWNYVMDNLLEILTPFLQELDDSNNKNVYGLESRSLSCGGAALKALADALTETGGRATWISHRRPNFGAGAIRDREAKSLKSYAHSRSESILVTPLQHFVGKFEKENVTNKADQTAAAFYKNLGDVCAKNRVCIDIVLVTPPTCSYLDVATLSELCRVTCGKLKWIRGNQNSMRGKEQLREELCRSVLSFSGSDAVFKVRCSEGLQVKSYMSYAAPGVTIENSLSESPEQEMSIVTPDTCIAVKLEHRVGGIPKSCNTAYIQTALLYTTSTGRRRVRVSTLALRTAVDAATVYRSADFGAVTAMLTRHAIAHVWNPKKKAAEEDGGSKLRAARDDVKTRCVDILANYRLHTSAKTSPFGQLILPETIQLLPLFCMSLVKSATIRPSLPKRESGIHVDHPSPNADERAYSLHYGLLVTPALAMLMVHPNVFSITNLKGGAGEWQRPSSEVPPATEMDQASYHAYVKLPRSTHPSITLLEDDGIYLIDTGLTLFVYVGKDVAPDVHRELFSEDNAGDPSIANLSISTSSDYGQQVSRLIWQLRTFCSVTGGSESVLRPTFAPVVVVQAGQDHKDPFQEQILTSMVTDPTSNEDDYVEFLCVLHRRIRQVVEKALS